jgi:fatty acid-binding protein DegV
VADYIRGRIEGRTDIGATRVFVTHSSVADESVAKAVELVHQLQPEAEVLVSQAGCTICSHCGPNCLGVLFITKA